MTATKDTSLVASPSPARALEMREQARHALTECRTTFDAMEVRNRAEAIRAYSKAAKDRTLEIEAMEIRADAERKLGQLLREVPRAKPGDNQYSGGSQSEPPPTLSDIGVSKKLSMQSQRLARESEEEWEETKRKWREEMATKPHGRVKVLRPDTSSDKPHVTRTTGLNEWYTPAPIVALARECMGGIDLDPASSAAANKIVKAGRYFDADTDGLAQEWSGRVWMNPPYSRDLVGRFVAKLLDSPISQAVVIVNNATETEWGQNLLSAAVAVCFPRGRVRYLRPDGDAKGAPVQGQMIVGVGVSRSAFGEAFGDMGVCV